VHFTVDFVKPTRYGDRLTFFLWTTRIGKTSCELRIEASHQGELRMRVKQVLVFISANTSRSTPIPPELISRMHRFEVEGEPQAGARKRRTAKTKTTTLPQDG
jgi:4-hydroxybenzoyl-CoA thioesterase